MFHIVFYVVLALSPILWIEDGAAILEKDMEQFEVNDFSRDILSAHVAWKMMARWGLDDWNGHEIHEW